MLELVFQVFINQIEKKEFVNMSKCCDKKTKQKHHLQPEKLVILQNWS